MSLDPRIWLKAWLISKIGTWTIRTPVVSLTKKRLPPSRTIDVPTRHGPVRCFVTRPASRDPEGRGGRPPVHINIHGGGFLVGEPWQDEPVIRAIAGEVDAVVVNIDYSRAPRVRYPHAQEECFDVLDWVARSSEDQDWDGDRISISGSSAGGNLALATLEQARLAGGPNILAAVLIVPLVDLTIPDAAYVSDIPKPFLAPKTIRFIKDAYFPDDVRGEPLASPALWETGISALPPLFIVAAQHDTLRPSIEAFAEKARSLGVDVAYRCIPAVDHDFSVNTEVAPRILPGLMPAITAHLRSHLTVRRDGSYTR